MLTKYEIPEDDNLIVCTAYPQAGILFCDASLWLTKHQTIHLIAALAKWLEMRLGDEDSHE